MKCKRILSMLLTLCMVMSLFAGTTVTASAADETTTLYVNGVDMLNESSTAPTGVSYDKSTNTLTLEKAELDQFYIGNPKYTWKYAAVIYAVGGNLTIKLIGDNKITYNDADASEKMQCTCGIYFNNVNLTITGGGKLAIQNTATQSKANFYRDICGEENSSLTINDATVECVPGSTTETLNAGVYGISLSKGALTVHNGQLTVRTRNATSEAYGIALYDVNATHKLDGNSQVTAVAGINDASWSSDYSYGIFYLSTIQLGAGAKLYASGEGTAIYENNSSITAAADAKLSVKGNQGYDKASSGLTEIQISNNTIQANAVKDYKTIEVTASASTPAAPTFTDGFGNNIDNANTYVKDKTTNDKGYTFAGWFDGDGNELTSAEAAVAGKTYTAKWTKNGKTVRTTSLDLTAISESNTLGAKYDNGVYVNTAEGWSWNAGTKTLTLSGCTIDIPGVADSAVSLPDGATLTTAANTQNTLSNVSTGSIEALWGEGAVTITGSGSLSLSGCDYGLSAGEITINAPITMIATNKQNGTAVAGGSITINSALSITKPSGGQIRENGGFHYIADRNGKFATNVVIGVAAPTFNDGLGKVDCAFDTYTKGATNDKGYTFAGWFNGETELTSADAAVVGTTYTAKWTKNGKTVRTASLDLTVISESNTFGATLTDGVYTNADEGWSWNPETKTLTLSGTTMDIPDRAQESQDDLAAVCLPDGAIITTAADTQNTLSNSSTIEMGSSAVLGMGALTVTGSGSLSVSGTNAGFYAMGNIAINAPITATATTERGGMAVLAKGITIDSSLDITVPTGGIIMTDRMTGIADSEGHFSANVVIGVAVKYTVTYNTNGGSAVAPVTVSENSKLIAPTAPTKDGYTFHGWYKDAAFTNGWNFDADTVTGNTTLYAKWTEATKIYGISGTVYAYGGTTTASGVSVKLMKGDTQVASATSATDGTYSFTGIAPGVYNIVAEKEDTTQTTLVIVTNHDETGKNVTLPQSKVNSKLTVNGADTPDVVAGGLDKEAAAVKADNSDATSVKVEMTVESKPAPADKTSIEAVAPDKTLEYLDIKVTKTVVDAASATTTTAITTTANMMEIIIPYDMTGKSNITVYRNHNGSATAFTQLNTLPGSGAVDGTYYLDTANHLIYVYTQKFSTYAIGYNTQSGGGSGSGGSSSGGGSSSSSGGSSSGNSSTISTPSAKNGTVSVSPKSASKGTTVTVTVTPDKGYVLETLTVTDASGKKLDLKNLGSGKYSFTMPASKVEVKATFMEDNTMLNYFVDVPASAYYYDAVLWAAEQGITGGTDATHFSPDGVCTRAQAVTFLWRAAGSPAPSATAMPFTDVAADSYYYNAVLWAMENGITVGTSSTTFSPNLNCSRAQIVTFLWRSEKSPAAGSVNPFTDVSADAYYADAVLWAVKESVTNGTSSATFSPDADCTRAQIVTFIWRTLAR